MGEFTQYGPCQVQEFFLLEERILVFSVQIKSQEGILHLCTQTKQNKTIKNTLFKFYGLVAQQTLTCHSWEKTAQLLLTVTQNELACTIRIVVQWNAAVIDTLVHFQQ